MKKIMAVIMCIIVAITFAGCASKVSVETQDGSASISQKENFIISFFKDQLAKNKSAGKKYNIFTFFMLLISLLAAFFGIFTVMDSDAQAAEQAKQKQQQESHHKNQ